LVFTITGIMYGGPGLMPDGPIVAVGEGTNVGVGEDRKPHPGSITSRAARMDRVASNRLLRSIWFSL